MDETDAHGREHELVQAVRSEWAQELREVREMVVDDVILEMRELIGVLVCRERCVEMKGDRGQKTGQNGEGKR